MFKGLLPLLACTMLGATGQLLLKNGVTLAKAAANQNISFGLMLRSPAAVFNVWTIGGFVAYGISSVVWLTLMSKYPLSFIYPMIALSYVFATIGAIIFFHDRTNVFTWASLTLIVMGVSLLARAGNH